MGPSPPTLRSRLLRRLWWPLLAVLLLSAVYDDLQALQRADRHDRLHFAVMGPDQRLIGGEATVFALGAADAGAAGATGAADGARLPNAAWVAPMCAW